MFKSANYWWKGSYSCTVCLVSGKRANGNNLFVKVLDCLSNCKANCKWKKFVALNPPWWDDSQIHPIALNLAIITTNDSISAAIAVRTFRDASLRMPHFFVVTPFISLSGGFWVFNCVVIVTVIPGHYLAFGIAYHMAPALSIRCTANLTALFIACTVLKTPKCRRYCGGRRCRGGCGDGGWCWCKDGAGGNRTCCSFQSSSAVTWLSSVQ